MLLSIWLSLVVLVSVNGFNVFPAHELSQQTDPYPILSDERHQNFRNFKLMRITPKKWEHLEYLKHLYEGSSPYELDFWQPPSHIGALVDVTVSPEDALLFADDLESKGINFVVTINDLQQAIDNERTENEVGDSMRDGSIQLDKYNRFHIIEDYLRKIRDENPNIVTLIEIGKTHENRSLTVVKLSGNRNSNAKEAIWIDGGIHAREWISSAVALNIINQLVIGYDSEPEIQHLINSIDWYILPVMNPDGYEYSHTKNRMWRKNRRPSECRKNYFHTVCCTGVDLNRNFDWFWASSGSSPDPCHETYHGTKSFSEPESRAVKEFLELIPPKGFITLHSYSQMWLIPYGHRRKSYPNDYTTALKPLALRATRALQRIHGTKYSIGTGADLMYEASGSSQDWAKGKLHVPYSYLIELRPKTITFTNGFLLPEREIKPTSEEIWIAIKIIGNELISQSMGNSISPKPITDSNRFTAMSSIQATISSTYGIDTTTIATDTTTTTDYVTTAMPIESTNAEYTSTRQTSRTNRQSTTTLTYSTTTKPSTSTNSVVEENSTSDQVGISTTKESPDSSSSSSTSLPPGQPPTIIVNIKCIDHGEYCKWWQVHNLCKLKRVHQLCTLSCHSQCIINQP